MKKYYITTPIYYVNDNPHLGHAYTTLAADIIARWHRKLGDEVFFLTGTDENGQKIEETAKKLNKELNEFVDEKSFAFKKLWKKLNISYDFFIRTTDNYHQIFVKNFIKKIYEKGDIYKGNYKGYYCVSCEQYYTKTEAPDLICPIHKKKLELMEEETYFFKLSKYQDKLLNFYEKNESFISPEIRKNEIINRVKEGLKDLSITRKKVKWGIKFPYDDSHTVYVWFDALNNYISALVAMGFQSYWPANLHLVGKEILWFHTVIWPAMLMSAGYELPKKVFAHGWWTVEGEKMSKSKGNVINPLEISEKYGTDSLRYYLFKSSFGNDLNFSYDDLNKAHNNELANNLGNLVTRVVSMTKKYFNGKIDNYEITNELDLEFIKKIEINKIIRINFERLDLSEALNSIFELIRETNAYINKVEPWKIKDKDRIREILGLLLSTIKLIAEFLEPFLPDTSLKISKILNIELNNNFQLELLKNINLNLDENPILFNKIATEKETELFEKLHLVIGKIIEIKKHPNADKLYIETIDIGTKKIQIISGLRDFYNEEELINKNVIVVINLKPTNIRGIISEGMLLAAESNKDVGILTVDENPGEIIITENGLKANNQKTIDIKDFQKTKLTAKNGFVFYKEQKLLTKNNKPVKIDKNIEGNVR